MRREEHSLPIMPNSLRDMGHDVRIVNPLPRLLKYMEQSRSTLTGVAKAPKYFEHNEFEIHAPRYIAYTDHPYPWLTARSIRNRRRSIREMAREIGALSASLRTLSGLLVNSHGHSQGVERSVDRCCPWS